MKTKSIILSAIFAVFTFSSLSQLKETVTLSIATLDGKIVHTQTIQPSNENIEITWKPF
jgi:hypothetical protein